MTHFETPRLQTDIFQTVITVAPGLNLVSREKSFPINFQLMSKIGSDLSLLELGQKLDQINGRKIFPFERR